MARPCRQRRIKRFPDHWEFFVNGDEQNEEEILLSLDEYEALRLIDHEGKTQVHPSMTAQGRSFQS